MNNPEIIELKTRIQQAKNVYQLQTYVAQLYQLLNMLSCGTGVPLCGTGVPLCGTGGTGGTDVPFLKTTNVLPSISDRPNIFVGLPGDITKNHFC